MKQNTNPTMANHITKQTHENGVQLAQKIAWCGRVLGNEWAFTDTHHALLSIDQQDYAALGVCKRCTNAIVKAIESNR